MQTNSGEWWDTSWNVAPGCTKVSPECDHCWALAMAKRLQGMKKPGYEGLVDEHGRWTGKVNLLASRWVEVLKLTGKRRIAVNLMGDLFHPAVPDKFILETFVMMKLAKPHNYFILTKRPDRMVEILACAYDAPLLHVWLGTTVGTQLSANQRWSAMARLAQMGWNTWVSSEPLLEAVDWHFWDFLKLMVVGGESGPYARPMAPIWARTALNWCLQHNVEYHFKQWGEWGPSVTHVADMPEGGWSLRDASRRPPRAASLPNKIDESNYPYTTFGDEMVFRFGRKLAGRVLDGCVWNARIGEDQL